LGENAQLSNKTFGLADLTNSIFNSLSVSQTFDTLGLGRLEQRECLILIDGLGQDAVNRYGDEFEIFSHLKQVKFLSANFPSTTATSLSTLGTGVLPGVHGMLGYTVRVPRSDNRLLNALKWDERVDPVMWQKVPTLFQRAVADGVSVTHVAAKRYEGSGFTQAALRGAKYVGANGIDEMVLAVSVALKSQPSFVYTYLNTLDSAGHSDGVGSDKWLTALSQVSEFITKVKLSAPAGTRVWVTSDHGMVNSTQQLILGQDNDLLKNVTLIGGEPRARHIYIKEGAESETILQWQEQLAGKAEVLSRESAISSGLFGEFVSQDSRERMGDLIAIAQNDLILIDPDRIREESSMVGHHGGVTNTEVEIPLLLG
jgi:predicted AlkP superfamily pyrophosphatase or phosphodiesterase